MIGKILNDSFSDYKKNFRPLLKFLALFIGIPSIISFFIFLYWANMYPSLYELNPANFNDIPLGYSISSFIIGLASFILLLYAGASIIKTSLVKEKFKLSDLLELKAGVFFSYILLLVVTAIFILGLFILLIIPGIIFMIYWSLAAFAFFDKKRGILNSLKESRRLIKGNWWRTVGYAVIISLISMALLFISSLLTLPNLFIAGHSYGLIVLSRIWSLLVNFASSVVIIPLSLLFFRNYYKQLKKENKS